MKPTQANTASSTSDVATTMIYTHVLKLGGGGVRSPADTLPELT